MAPDVKLTYAQAKTITISKLVEHSKQAFKPADEIEWFLIAHAVYSPDERGFYSGMGSYLRFEELVETLIETPLGSGSCHGAHQLYTLAYLLKKNNRISWMPPRLERRASEVLAAAVQFLDSTLLADGSWDSDCYGNTKSPVALEFRSRFSITAHNLEWLSLLPKSQSVSQESLELAFAYIASSIMKKTDSEIYLEYGAVTHGISGLSRLGNQSSL